MTTIKQYNTGTAQWETIVVGKQGPGVATGGTTGQFLQKTSSTNYATTWVDAGEDDQIVLGAQVFG